MRWYGAVVVMLAALASATSAAALCGDADGSGALAINDIVRHLRVVSGLDAAADLCDGAGYADCADLNGDGTGPTDISDTVLLLRRASNVPNCAADQCFGRINAVGTAAIPITWTSSKPPGMRLVNDWTGIMLLGRAPVNEPDIGVDGITDAFFGGDERDDFSGCMAYNRIQFAGRNLVPEWVGSENHLSLYGVGNRTVLHHVHAHLGHENCFLWFGGTVTASHLIASACGDDAFDVQLGTTGGVQFGLVAQRGENVSSGGSNAFELDNSEFGHDKEPRTDARFCNVTAIGVRYSAANPGVTNQVGVFSRRGNAMTIANTIVKDFRQGGYQLRDAATAARACLDPATLNPTPPVGTIRNSLFTDNGGDGTTHALNHSSCDAPGECTCTPTEHFGLLQAQRAVLTTSDPAVQAIGGHAFPPVDLVPPVGSLPDTHPAADCTTIHPAFVDAPYVGAFEPGGEDWTAGWADYPVN